MTVLRMLFGTAEVSASLRNAGSSWPQLPSSCPYRVSSRSEAPWRASADAHSSCVPLATCASPCALTWTNVVSRARQLRPARLLRIWAAALGRLSGSVAEELGVLKMAMRFACRGWPYGVDSLCVWRMRVVSLDVAPVP